MSRRPTNSLALLTMYPSASTIVPNARCSPSAIITATLARASRITGSNASRTSASGAKRGRSPRSR
jgi:hypothetical protein